MDYCPHPSPPVCLKGTGNIKKCPQMLSLFLLHLILTNILTILADVKIKYKLKTYLTTQFNIKFERNFYVILENKQIGRGSICIPFAILEAVVCQCLII